MGRTVGSKNTKITPQQLAMYAGAMCTQREVAAIVGVHPSTIAKMLEKPAYREAWDRAQENTRYLIRKRQIENALEGKTVDLIWMGKQYLGQRDSVHEVKTETNVKVEFIAAWGGGSGELPPAEDDNLIEGEVEDE